MQNMCSLTVLLVRLPVNSRLLVKFLGNQKLYGNLQLFEGQSTKPGIVQKSAVYKKASKIIPTATAFSNFVLQNFHK